MPLTDTENNDPSPESSASNNITVNEGGKRDENRINDVSSNSESTVTGDDHSDTSTSSSEEVTDGAGPENGSESGSNENSPQNRMERREQEMPLRENLRTTQRNYSDITSDGEDESGANAAEETENITSETPKSPAASEKGQPVGAHIPIHSISCEEVIESCSSSGSSSEDEGAHAVHRGDSRNRKAKANKMRDDEDSNDDYDENSSDADDEDNACNQELEGNEDDDMDEDESEDREHDGTAFDVRQKQQQLQQYPEHLTINLESEPSHAKNFEIEIGSDKVYNIRRHDYSVHAGQILEMRCTDKSNKPNEYYVHYLGLNRRLDEWVKRHRISEYIKNKKSEKEVPISSQVAGDNADQFYDRKVTRNFAEMDQTSAQLEKEHESITKVKYINKAIIGHFEIDAWYFSPFPNEYAKVPTIYICEFCLKYMNLGTYGYHLHTCDKRGPPGRIVYSDGKLAIYKIDGEIVANQLYCQLLCLMAKLFLDHKTLYYDVAPFDFYVLCELDKTHAHIVGYFSKEKISKDNNVACILILPPYQRKGYGKLLIDFSYYLSRRKGEIGGPEKPLSDLGRLSYRSYWAYTLLQLMSECQEASMSIDDLSTGSGITKADIYYTLKSMKLIKYWKGKTVICVTRETIAQLLLLPQFRRPKLIIDESKVDLGYTDGPSTSKRTVT